MDLLQIILQNTKDIKKLKKQVTCCSIPTSVSTALPEYTDNAAAIAGGLVVGNLYRTGDVLKVVHA